MSKYKLKEKDQVGFGRRVQLQFKYKYFLVFIFIYVHIYVDICFICKEINKEILLCCCWYMAHIIWVEIWGNHQRCFDCPGVQGKTFRSWNIWGLDWNVCNKCCLWEERCALCEALGGYSWVVLQTQKYWNPEIQIYKSRNTEMMLTGRRVCVVWDPWEVF